MRVLREKVMLDDNNHKNSTCAFAEQTVAYLYGEIDAQEKTLFETHLTSCAACAEEFAGFGAVRSSVIHWRDEEFLSLETPPIEIPYEKTGEFFNAEIDSKVPHSWFEELRRLFSLSPALTASASVAIVAICLGIVFFANKSSNNSDVAVINSENTKQTISSPKTGEQNFSDTASDNASAKQNDESSSLEESKFLAADAANKNQKSNYESKTARKNSIVKVPEASSISAKNLNREATSIKIKAVNVENKKQTFAQTDKVPRLNNVEEDEDKSLRLAELLEDDDAK